MMQQARRRRRGRAAASRRLGLPFVVAEAADHAVGAAIVLDLLHAVAVAGAIGQVAPLGDDAVERAAGRASAIFARSASLVVAGDRRKRRLCDAKCFRRIASSRRAALCERHASASLLAVAVASRSKTMKQRRRLGGSFWMRLAAGWMRCSSASNENALPCGTTISPSSTKLLGLERAHRLDQLGKVARQRLAGFRLQLDLSSPSRNARQRKPSHFGSYCHSGPSGICVDRQRFHRAAISADADARAMASSTQTAGYCAGRRRNNFCFERGSHRSGDPLLAASASARRRPGARPSRRS